MTVTVTDRALEVIGRSLDMASGDDLAVRLRRAGGAIRPRFVSAPSEGDEVIEAGGIRIFVAADIASEGDVVVDVTTEHDTLTVRHA